MKLMIGYVRIGKVEDNKEEFEKVREGKYIL